MQTMVAASFILRYSMIELINSDCKWLEDGWLLGKVDYILYDTEPGGIVYSSVSLVGPKEICLS